jgi:hypothetical protein
MGFGLNREIERRANALIAINKREAGGTLRIGGGWRSDKRANSEWERRYTPTTQTARIKDTDKKYNGVWYSLNPGEIGVATPGNSYHVTQPPDALCGDTGAVAIDWVNELKWMQTNCHRVGLKSFQHVKGEGHHTQPVEYPESRKSYSPSKHRLTVWPIDATPPPVVPSDVPASVRRGDRNCTVALLQQKLGITSDGWFGPQTEKTVRNFQKAHGLYVDGWVGPKTWAVILG